MGYMKWDLLSIYVSADVDQLIWTEAPRTHFNIKTDHLSIEIINIMGIHELLRSNIEMAPWS